MWRLFLLVLWLGAVSFGGGQILLGGLERQLVQTGQVTPQQFAAAVALGQSTPGPLAAFTSAIGIAAAGLGGAVGASLALVTVSSASVWLIQRIPPGWFHHPRVRSGLAAVGPLAVALSFFLAGRSLFAGSSPGIIGLVAAGAVAFGKVRKVPTTVLVLAVVAVGMALA